MAVAAICIAALAPAISHAVRSGGSAGWAELCTVAGSRWVLTDGASTAPQPQPAPAHGLEHCPYCSFHMPALGLPPPAAMLALVASPTHEVPHLDRLAPRPLHAWPAALARAPPQLSA